MTALSDYINDISQRDLFTAFLDYCATQLRSPLDAETIRKRIAEALPDCPLGDTHDWLQSLCATPWTHEQTSVVRRYLNEDLKIARPDERD